MKCDKVDCKNRNKKLGECSYPEYMRSIMHDGTCSRFEKILTPKERAEKYWKEKMKDKPYHLVYSATLLGNVASQWACGCKRKHEHGFFGTDGTFGNIDCEECKKTKLYKAIEDGTYTDEAYEAGEYDEHPRSETAKKAWETRKQRMAL